MLGARVGAHSRMQLLSDVSTASVYTGVLLSPLYFDLNERPSTGEPVNHQLSYCLETPASEASRLSGAGAKISRQGGEKQFPRESFSCRVCFKRDGSRCQGAGVHGVFQGNNYATGHTKLENLLMGGSIHLFLSQRGWSL
jgi:hypothetical protein